MLRAESFLFDFDFDFEFEFEFELYTGKLRVCGCGVISCDMMSISI